MSTSRRRPIQRVFVDVPVSPYPLSRYPSLSSKENAPLTPTASLLHRKRKLSDPDPSSLASPKKQKLASGNTNFKLAGDFPNGFIYCHQCSRKRDKSAAVHCTVKEILISKDKSTTEQRCTVKFCRSCLKNRYGEDLDLIKSQKSPGKKGHVNTENYIFKCPKCRDFCNCSRCRKSKGLEPTGSLTSLVRKTGAGSAAQYLATGSNILLNNVHGKQVERSKKPTNPVKAQPKAIPVPRWNKIPVNFDVKEAEARFGIREFTMRFARIMEPPIAKVHLMELEDISGKYPEDEEEIAGWVSEACVRAITLGVLGLLARQDDESFAKPVAVALKDIRATGTNLNRIWTILSRLRDAANDEPERGIHLYIPDPLPTPSSSSMHNTRNMRSARDSHGAASIHIAQSAQMIPVVQALIEAAIHTDMVREELEAGVRDGKDLTKTVREYCRKENERRDVERKTIRASLKDNEKTKGFPPQMKMKWEAQKRRLHHLENALNLVLPGFAPRFVPLGSDSEERLFWALSPGAADRKAALDFITKVTSSSGEAPRQNRKSRGTVSVEERDAMKQWSWFVAVWGKKPVDEKDLAHTLKRDNDEESDSEEDEDVERWWAVGKPEEIRTCAKWVAMKSVEGESLDGRYSSLVKGLNDYAVLLEWRLLEDKFDTGNTADD